MTDDDNPYRSPTAEDADVPVIRTVDGRSVEAALIHRGWCYRKVHLSGGIEAVVEYNGRGLGFETVRVNRRVVLRAANWDWRPWGHLVPHLEFQIGDDTTQIRGTIDVRGSFLGVTAFRISIGERLVYSEGGW